MEETENLDSTTSKTEISTEFIRLGSFLKFCGESVTGAEAKNIICAEKVKVNGEICNSRGKKLLPGDVVEVSEKIYRVVKM